MNIIVPIHLEALRASPSTNQKAKQALYDFTSLGQHPASCMGDLIASNQFAHAESNLSPGIHLHWTLPKAYTRGRQDSDTGQIHYPVMPNRWLVVRFLKDNQKQTGNTATRMWVLESDAFSDQDTSTVVPWMNNAFDLQGLQKKFLGRLSGFTSTWTEPTASTGSDQTVDYLGNKFQATYGYGATFTAFYPNCTNVLGFCDDLSDYYKTNLEYNTDFTVSYVVMGWVSNTSDDECNIVVNQALDAYNKMTGDKPDFPTYLKSRFEDNLRWSLSSFSDFTTRNSGTTQAVMSGILSDITWNLTGRDNPSYPSESPDASQIQVAIGNNTAEAMSAYINQIEAANVSLANEDGGIGNMEWLLNALQFNQLAELSAGIKGVGQLEEFLHGTAFSNVAGGYQWDVRQKQSDQTSSNHEIPLPAFLTKVLAELNAKQAALHETCDQISTRQQQLFFDWVYHIRLIDNEVINPGENTPAKNIGYDTSGTMLMDGLFQLFPEMLKAGKYIETGVPPSAPYKPKPDSFSIQIPEKITDYDNSLSTYKFNLKFNTPAGTMVTDLLELGFGMDQSAGLAFSAATANLTAAQKLLKLAKQGGKDADDYITSTKKLVTTAGENLGSALSSFTLLSDASKGIAAQKTKIKTALSSLQAYVDPVDGLFAKYLQYTPDPGNAPLPPGQIYRGELKGGWNRQKIIGFWDHKPESKFIGIKAQMDEFTGQGLSQRSVIDISDAALYLGYSYLYINSNSPYSGVSAYYLQMCEGAIKAGIKAGNNAKTALDSAATNLGSSKMVGLINDLNTMVTSTIKTILSDLNQAQPDVQAALSEIKVMLAPAGSSSNAPSIPQFQAFEREPNWQNLREKLGEAQDAIAGQLSHAQQVSIWNKFLYTKVEKLFELTAMPADHFHKPTEPVILLAEKKSGGDLLAPFKRNGQTETLPCRLTSELVADSSVAFPSDITAISNGLNTKISDMSALLQSLAEEAYLLTPELSHIPNLKKAALKNKELHYNKIHDVELNTAPASLSGKLPYYIAYNWRNDKNMDPFIPLFIWWKVKYRFSKTYDFENESFSSNALDAFQLGQYEAELQPNSDNISDFAAQTTPNSNTYTFHGLISLSSSATTSLTSQIQTYCKNYLSYDPVKPPASETDNYEEKLKFHHAYNDYKNRNVLSQGLSGFNSGLVTRAQELQIPINIPESWTSSGKAEFEDLWPTQFLHAQSSDWPVDWNAEGPNTNAYAAGEDKVYFNPLRAGFMDIAAITLVDSFGRWVEIPQPSPYAISSNMSSSQPAPVDKYSTYLAPRMVQPSRVNFEWCTANMPNGIGSFVESGDQPAASPICGWLWPNHLNHSLMLYDAMGHPMGSLGLRETTLHWYPVPGETTTTGGENRQDMIKYFKQLVANQVFVDYVTKFLYPDTTSATTTRFKSFLEALSKAQAFVVSPSQQQDAELSVLMGRPSVITQSMISITQKGVPTVGLNPKTYPSWAGNNNQFTLTSDKYVPYNFENFDTGDMALLDIKTRIGMAETQTQNGPNIPHFDDGVVGYFIGETWNKFYTPVDMTSVDGLISVAAAGATPLSLTPNGAAKKLTIVMDPTAAIHATTGILPTKSIVVPPNLYSKVLSRLQMTLLTTPVLKYQNPPVLPLPPEKGYAWSWVHVGANDTPIKPSQSSTNAVFPQTPQSLVDGWLKLTKPSN